MPAVARDDSDAAQDTPALQCALTGGFSIFVQLAIGILALASLVIKRHFEHPKRTWLVWSLDVGKQVSGGSLMHLCNLVAAAVTGVTTGRGTDPCIWYFLHLFLDTTVGVFILYGYLSIVERIARRYGIRGLQSGDYGDPPVISKWVKQTLIFAGCLLLMKGTVVLAISIFPFLFTLGNWIMTPVRSFNSQEIEIVFVMAIAPLILNIFEFWIVDQVIKQRVFKPDGASAGSSNGRETDHNMYASVARSDEFDQGISGGSGPDRHSISPIELEEIQVHRFDVDDYDDNDDDDKGTARIPALPVQHSRVSRTRHGLSSSYSLDGEDHDDLPGDQELGLHHVKLKP